MMSLKSATSSVLLLIAFLAVALLTLAARAADDDISAPFPGVVDLDATNFDSVVGKDQAVLVEFYAPWCGWCKRLAPNYKKVASLVTGSTHAKDVIIAKVNADQHGELSSRFGVRGFPTIMLFKKGDISTPIQYGGDRSPADLVKFINREAVVNIPDGSAPAAEPAAAATATADAAAPETATDEKKKQSQVVILTPDNFDTIVLDADKNVFVKFYAPWCGHCKRMAPAYDELAAKFGGETDVVIAKVDASEHRSIGSRFGIRGFPTLKFFTKTDKTGNLAHSGGRDVTSMEKFINENRVSGPATPTSHDEF